MIGRPWTPAEDATLRAEYTRGRVAPISVRLGRTPSSVHHRAHRLGLIAARRWTLADLRLLRNLWGEVDLPTLAKRLGRSVATTYWKAQQLDLLGCPRGREYLTDAATRTGFSTSTLRRILAWHGVKLRRAMSRVLQPKTKRRMHAVDPFDVNEAVAAWLATETPTAAARRLGVTGETVAARVARLVDAPPRPKRRRHWRIPSEVIDRALGVAA